jgi:hypothetical protein
VKFLLEGLYPFLITIKYSFVFTLSLALSLKGEGIRGLLRGVAPLLELPALQQENSYYGGFAPLSTPCFLKGNQFL